jgi:hypothetical protein
VIALTDQPDSLVCNTKPDFCDSAFDSWLRTVNSGKKQILIDNLPADRESLKTRLSEFWLPDETIIYIGKAGPSRSRTLRKRVNEFYLTKLGCDKKHAGGHWLNVLQNINDLNVYYGIYTNDDIESLEEKMLTCFINNVSKESKLLLYDNTNCFPFANKEFHMHSLETKIKKNHGLKNQTIYCGQKWKK